MLSKPAELAEGQPPMMGEAELLEPMAPMGAEITVPLEALAEIDEREQAVDPSEGDVVTFTVEGVVTRVVGELKQAVIQPKTINGESVEEQDQPNSMDSEEAELRRMADERMV